jgi:hypothetical protein
MKETFAFMKHKYGPSLFICKLRNFIFLKIG